MHNADISNGRRGHLSRDDPEAQMLSAEQAAPLLGCTVRHVRRLIARGDLAGRKDPYRTWRSALDAYRRQRSPHEGDLVAQRGADIQMSASGQDGTGVLAREEEDDESTAVMVAIAAELAGAREQIERLARENGRLQALLEARPAPQSGEAALGGPAVRRRSRGPLGRLLALLWCAP